MSLLGPSIHPPLKIPAVFHVFTTAIHISAATFEGNRLEANQGCVLHDLLEKLDLRAALSR